jgi:lactate racemase
VNVTLAYGRQGLEAELPDDATVVLPTDLPGLADEAQAVREALRNPLDGPTVSQLVAASPRGQVVVVFPDITRPMPNRTVLPPLLEELEAAGAGPERVELLCATGTHRPADPGELEELIGAEILDRYPVHQHRSDDDRHVMVGRVDGAAVNLDARYVSSDIRIVTGFVEPHFFAGFSGGPKAVCPGLADTATTLEAHSPVRIADRSATWLVTEGNPVHDFVRAATDLAPPDLSVDVTINNARQLTSAFCGPLPGGHRRAMRFVEESALKAVDRRFEVVVTTNGGYPLDRNLYQAVKGMAAAEAVVAPGGIIVAAAACSDGVPSGGAFARLLTGADDAAAMADGSGASELDRWQVQVLGRVLGRAEVWLYSSGLTGDEVRGAHLRPVDSLDAAIEEALKQMGSGARCCVLPQGPFTVVRAP